MAAEAESEEIISFGADSDNEDTFNTSGKNASTAVPPVLGQHSPDEGKESSESSVTSLGETGLPRDSTNDGSTSEDGSSQVSSVGSSSDSPLTSFRKFLSDHQRGLPVDTIRPRLEKFLLDYDGVLQLNEAEILSACALARDLDPSLPPVMDLAAFCLQPNRTKSTMENDLPEKDGHGPGAMTVAQSRISRTVQATALE